MAQLYAVAGSKIFIGSRVQGKGLVTAADFADQVWTEIGGWTNAGAIGDTQEVISQSFINERRVRKIKGTRDGGTMENQFAPDGQDAGQIAFKAAIEDCKPHAFKIEWGADCPNEAIVTISVATPGVITWTGHGLVAGQPVSFTTTGTLPTGLAVDTTYYVVASGLTSNSFSVAATPGGSAIATTVAGSGVHTATAGELGMTDMFYGLALPGSKQGGESNTVQLRSWSIAIDSNIVEI